MYLAASLNKNIVILDTSHGSSALHISDVVYGSFSWSFKSLKTCVSFTILVKTPPTIIVFMRIFLLDNSKDNGLAIASSDALLIIYGICPFAN